MKEILAPLVFLALFLGIVGTALFLTPRLAAWLDRKRLMSKGPYADMMEAPAAPAGEKNGAAASDGTDPADKTGGPEEEGEKNGH